MFTRLFSLFQQPPATRQTGNTRLHDIVVCQPANVCEEVSLLIQNESEAAVSMALTTNDQGQLPIDLALQQAPTLEIKQELSKLISPLMRKKQLKKLTEILDIDSIHREYGFPVDSEIYKNLQIACQLANDARKTIHLSYTHTDVNTLSAEEKIDIKDKVTKVRQTPLSLNLVHDFHEIVFDPETLILKKSAQHTIQHGAGNCGNFAWVTRYLASEQYPKLLAQLYTVKNGDHEFLVLGKDNHAVVCDAWAGEIYPFADVPKKLNAFRHFVNADNTYLNILPSYNPRFHRIEPSFELTKATAALRFKSGVMLGLFATATVAAGTALLSYSSSANRVSKASA